MRKIRIGFLVSGNGGTLKFILLAAQKLNLPFEVTIVLADRACGALEYARTTGLPCQQIKYKRDNTEELRGALHRASPDIVITNIHKIIDAETLRLLPNLFINLHYSLLPAFKGLIGMQTLEQARLINATIVGATCHELNEQVDSGRCLAQVAMAVDWNRDEMQEVAELIFRAANSILLQELIQRASGVKPGSSTVCLMLERYLTFTPALSFDFTEFDEAFWQKIKAA
jgi:phosphoribosylglycinamide formyltransferase-1